MFEFNQVSRRIMRVGGTWAVGGTGSARENDFDKAVTSFSFTSKPPTHFSRLVEEEKEKEKEKEEEEEASEN